MPSILPSELSPRSVIKHELARLKNDWWWFLLLGILLVLGGITALAYPFCTTVGIVVVLGTILIIGGVATIVAAFWTGRWSAFLMQVLIGVLYVVTGVAMTDVPAEAAAVLTLFVAAAFLVGGIFRIIAALSEKFSQWGWVLLNGIITMMMGVLIIKSYPNSALWVIGVLIGVEMIFNGWSWIMLSQVIRNLPVEEETTAATTVTTA